MTINGAGTGIIEVAITDTGRLEFDDVKIMSALKFSETISGGSITVKNLKNSGGLIGGKSSINGTQINKVGDGEWPLYKTVDFDGTINIAGGKVVLYSSAAFINNVNLVAARPLLLHQIPQV
jgi:hypothetical protein